MTFPRTALPFVMVLLLALLVVACGSEDASRDAGGSGDGTSESAREADTSRDEPTPQEASEERTSGGGAFAITPELGSCMEAAGFSQDAPPTGGLVAWRHATGGRVVVASSTGVTDGIAAEIGTDFLAEVSERVVIAAPAEHALAADDCLHRFAA